MVRTVSLASIREPHFLMSEQSLSRVRSMPIVAEEAKEVSDESRYARETDAVAVPLG